MTTCLFCGSPVIPTAHHVQLYCCRRHGVLYRQQQHERAELDALGGERKPALCVNCGDPIPERRQNNVRGKVKYCSPKCGNQAWMKTHRTSEVANPYPARDNSRERAVKIVQAPAGCDFKPGASFDLASARDTIAKGYMDPGVVIEFDGRRAKVVDGGRLAIGGSIMPVYKFLKGAKNE